MSKNNNNLQPQERLLVDAALTLQQNIETKELIKSLCSMYMAYVELRNKEDVQNSDLPAVTYQYQLLVAYLFTITEDFHENHTDYNGIFDDVMERYELGDLYNQKTQSDE